MVYTPGLIVNARTFLEKVRRLPMKGEVLVKEGDPVESGTVVARTELPGGIRPVNAASLLGVEPKDLPDRMLVREGDLVEGGERIAATKGFLGLFPSSVAAPGKGTIERISPITGQVILREPPRPVTLKAYIDGEVAKVLPEEGAIIRAEAAFIQGIFGLGGETRGGIAVKVAGPGDVLEPDALDQGDAGKIIVGGSLVGMEALKRAIEINAAGVVTGGVDYQDLERLPGSGGAAGITGVESLKTTIVVTEGFGRVAMAQQVFDLISRFDGHDASMNGATQIRAGVIRPEVIIGLAHRSDEEAAGPRKEGAALEVGTLVRVIREPYFGVIGRVASLPAEPLRMESEIRAAGVAIETSDAGLIEVPRSNVEIIAP
jgi:hypothetical protein